MVSVSRISIPPFLGLEPGDRDRTGFINRPSVAAPPNQRMVQPAGVVAPGVVKPVVGAAALGAPAGGPGGDLAELQQAPQFQVFDELLVERVFSGGDPQLLVAVTEGGELLHGLPEFL